jgi:quercetin 2,3-dioxygenase
MLLLIRSINLSAILCTFTIQVELLMLRLIAIALAQPICWGRRFCAGRRYANANGTIIGLITIVSIAPKLEAMTFIEPFTALNLSDDMISTTVHTIHDRNLRGHTKIGWLDSRHTFSFGNFQDPNRMGFRSLRVINDDRVIPGAGFGTHGHRDMEILTYVLEGELAHKDSLGTGSVIRPGDVQIMSAGTGIQHSEFNNSASEPVHFLQIWMLPDRQNISPRYDQRDFPLTEKQGKLRLVASKDGREGSVVIHQDINLYVSILSTGERITFQTPPNRFAWVQVAKGMATLNGESLREGDGIQINSPELLEMTTESDAEVLLFDLA